MVLFVSRATQIKYCLYPQSDLGRLCESGCCPDDRNRTNSAENKMMCYCGEK